MKDASGEIVELRCTWDPATRGGNAPDGRKVASTLHWVSAAHAIPAEVRLYETLFSVEDPMGEAAAKGVDHTSFLNPQLGARARASAGSSRASRGAQPGTAFQFERLGYFAVDPERKPGALVFNRTVTLRDEWTKLQKRASK